MTIFPKSSHFMILQKNYDFVNSQTEEIVCKFLLIIMVFIKNDFQFPYLDKKII